MSAGGGFEASVRTLPSPPPTAGFDRVPPHNLQAEISVLGSMLLSRNAIADVSEVVGAEDFYRGAHRTIFEAARDLYDRGEPVDTVTLADELAGRGKLEDVGGIVALSELVRLVPTSANALYYARIVADQALRRRLIDAGTEITRTGYDPERDVAEVVDNAERMVFDVAQRRGSNEFTPMKDLLNASFELIEKLHDQSSAITGLATGFTDFDELTAGLQPSNLVILAARPAMGKCLGSSTRVLDPSSGAVRTIADIVADSGVRPQEVVALDAGTTLRAAQPSAYLHNGRKPVFRLRTRLGREVVATANHPLLTRGGWVALSQLQPGARIATPRQLPFFGTRRLTDADLAPDPGAPAVPEAVFCAPRDQVALFLSRLFAGSGCVHAGRTAARITCTGVSRRLARDVQHLLLRFGVLAEARRVVRVTSSGRVAPTWELQVTEPGSVGTFARQIGIPGHEAQLAAAAAVSVSRRQSVPAAGRPAVAARQQGAGAATGVLLAEPPGTADVGEPLDGDIYWDEVVAIEPAGEDDVYDLTVPGPHNFVADDMVVHNSTLVTNLASHVAVELREPVVLFSLEMSQMELVQRVLAAEARVDSDRLRTGRLQDSDWPKLSQAMGRLAEAPLFIDDTPGINLLEIRSKARRLKQKHGLSLVIIDYLQLMQSHRRVENRVQEVAEFSRGLKILAKELEVPVIALSQLSRKPEDRSDRRPQLADLRESGSIEQDADIVCFIYRDEVYDQDSAAKGEAELIVAKHRNGPLRTIRLSFIGHHSRFANMARGPGRAGGPPL